MNDSVMDAVEQLKADGMTVSGIVHELVDSEFNFPEIAKIFGALGHFVALGPGATKFRGEMLISDTPEPLKVGSTATSISWGHGGTREDELPLPNHPEEVLVGALLKQGVPIKEVVDRLFVVGLSVSELRDLFTLLGHRIYGGGYGEPEGWMLIASHPGDPTANTDFASVYWSEPEEAVTSESANE